MADRILRAIITGDAAGAVRASRETSAAFDTVGGKADGLGNKLKSLSGTVGLGMVMGLAAAGGAAIDLGTKFQSAMELIHTQAGASQAEVNKMSNAVLALAGPTAQSPDALAAGLFHLESAGMRGQKALNALKIAAEGATLGHADLESVTNALNAAISSGIPGVQNAQAAMGALNATVGAGDMRMQDLADAMGSGLLAVVKGYGLSMNDVGAALATFGDNNIRGANAATELRMAVMAFAAPVKAGKATLASLGMTMTQLGTDMQKGGLNLALTDLHKHLLAAGDTGSKVGAVLTQAFGKKAGVGIQVLESQFARFETKTKQVAAGAAGFGGAWIATTKTFAFQLESAKDTVIALATRLGEALIPKLTILMHAIEDVVIWLTKHKAIAEALGIAVATIGAVMLGIWIANTIAAMTFWTAATAGIALLVVALAAGIAWIVTHWGTVVGFFKKIWGDVENVFLSVGHAIGHFLSSGPIGVAMKFLTDYIKLQLDVITTVFKIAWDAIKAVIMVAWDIIKSIFTVAWDIIKGIFITSLDLITGKWGAAWNAITSTVSSVLGTIWGTIKSVFGTIAGFFTSTWSAITSGVRTAWNDIVGLFQTAGSAIWNALKGIGNDIEGPFRDAFNFIATMWDDTIGKMFHGQFIGALGIGFNMPNLQIPHFAQGGIVTQPTLALIGEAGPEAIVPLSGRGGSSGTGGGGATNNNTYYFQVVSNDPQSVVNALRTYIQRNGSLANAGVA